MGVALPAAVGVGVGGGVAVGPGTGVPFGPGTGVPVGPGLGVEVGVFVTTTVFGVAVAVGVAVGELPKTCGWVAKKAPARIASTTMTNRTTSHQRWPELGVG